MKITDKMRLDWLVKKEVAINSYCGRFWFSFYAGKMRRPIPDFKCPRKLIDAEIRKGKKP